MLSTESSNIAAIPFVAMALQTAEQINDAYMRKMNRDYAAYIPNPLTTSIAQIPSSTTSIGQTNIEQESY